MECWLLAAGIWRGREGWMENYAGRWMEMCITEEVTRWQHNALLVLLIDPHIAGKQEKVEWKMQVVHEVSIRNLKKTCFSEGREHKREKKCAKLEDDLIGLLKDCKFSRKTKHLHCYPFASYQSSLHHQKGSKKIWDFWNSSLLFSLFSFVMA